MTSYDYYRIVIDAVTVAIIPSGVFVGRLLKTIKTNDLRHIDAKLDLIKENVDKVDEKLERHLEAHAEGKFDRSK